VIYLDEREGQYVGPFRSREDSTRFVGLMGLCGEVWAGAELVVEKGGLDPTVSPTDHVQ
jgi:hypothetical protein